MISTAKAKLQKIAIIMVIWATVVTIALIIIVVFAFNRLRHRPEYLGHSADSYVSDAESGHKSEVGSVFNLDIDQQGPIVTGEGHEVGVNIDCNNDFEVEKISALFEEDDNCGSCATTVAQGESRPNFRNVMTNGHQATSSGQFRGLFFPDSGSTTF
jgi:hypothetical protein